MMALNVFGDVWGNGFSMGSDARALSNAEIKEMQISQLRAMEPAVYTDEYFRSLANYNPYPERPLDDRFADFKIRLTAAFARRAK